MKNVNFQQKELMNYKGVVLCDADNFPKIYSGAKKAQESATKCGGKIYQINLLKERYYVVK